MSSMDWSFEGVCAGLGDKVTAGLALMIAQTRSDLDVYRSTFPGWATDASERGLLNWCHDRMWAHATRIFDGITEVTVIDKLPRREITVGLTYRLRVKKHDPEGAVSTYLTQGALDFLEQDDLVLDGMQEVRLISGYRWHADERRIGNAVLSLRNGPYKVIWMHDLDEPEEHLISPAVPILPAQPPKRPTIEIAGETRTDERNLENP